MSLRVNPTATVVVPTKDHSLRLLKQKVKRGHSGHFQVSDQDNFRKDVSEMFVALYIRRTVGCNFT